MVEPTDVGIRIVTPRGALIAALTADCRAFERVRSIVFALPDRSDAGPRHRALTERGPDRAAARAQDRDAILFDLGLGSVPIAAAIRSADPELVAALRAGCGTDLFVPRAMALLGAVAAASPQRVFESGLGRIEVYTPIPPPKGRTNPGPHTHLLPQFFGRRAPPHPDDPILPAGWHAALSVFRPRFTAHEN
ncbi:MAG: hypothetical protein FJX46_05935 [Alphaproteobacteria bacterium]|nr:hypothetical protein [Alphaproteobacteria bacterium]